MEELESLAATGNTDAMQTIGVLFNLKGDLENAHPWMLRAADAGDVRAQAYMGWIFNLLGDTDLAIEYTQMAIDGGDPNAAQMMKGLVNPPDFDDQFTKIYALTAKRLGDAAFELGNEDQAAESWTRAADNGDIDSLFRLGERWERQGTLGHALIFYGKASRAGHTEAMLHFGLLLDRLGKREEAEGWFENSANGGNAKAWQVIAK